MRTLSTDRNQTVISNYQAHTMPSSTSLTSRPVQFLQNERHSYNLPQNDASGTFAHKPYHNTIPETFAHHRRESETRESVLNEASAKFDHYNQVYRDFLARHRSRSHLDQMGANTPGFSQSREDIGTLMREGLGVEGDALMRNLMDGEKRMMEQ